MNLKLIFSILLSLLICKSLQAFTLEVKTPLQTYQCSHCNGLSHDRLTTSWPISDLPLIHETKHQQTSCKYEIETRLTQLRSGVLIYTDAPGALLRITSRQPNSQVKPEFYLSGIPNQRLSLIEASSLFSQEAALKNTPFTNDTLALAQLKPELGFGKFIITSSVITDMDKDEPFIIHVYDRNSTTRLTLATDKARYYPGEELTATLTLQDNSMIYPINDLSVSLISPAGETTSLTTNQLSSNTVQAKIHLNSSKNTAGANWYIDAVVSSYVGEHVIKRHAHTAFSYIIPSAAVIELIKEDSENLNFSAVVDVASDSRYALQTVLFASDDQGVLYPIQTAQTADWFSTGQHILHFSFDPKVKTSYKAPYYLGYIHLIDFGQMKPVFEYDTPIELSKLIRHSSG